MRTASTKAPPVLDLEDSDFLFEDLPSQDRFLDRIIDLCVRPRGILATSDPLMDVQVLAPMKKGVLGFGTSTRSCSGFNRPKRASTNISAGT
jgi:hypothetical protein